MLAVGLHAVVRPLAPLLTPEDFEIRVRMALDFLQLDPLDMLFTDEKWFDCDDHGTRYEWVFEGEYPSRRVRGLHPNKIHVWGCIGRGVKILVIFPEGVYVKKHEYILYCLEAHKAQLKKLSREGRLFQQDNAPPHRAKETQLWFEKNKVKKLEKWPARSPDMNMIEKLWAILAQRVSAHGPTSRAALQKFLRQEWDNLSQETIDNLLLGWHGTLRQVIDLRGATV